MNEYCSFTDFQTQKLQQISNEMNELKIHQSYLNSIEYSEHFETLIKLEKDYEFYQKLKQMDITKHTQVLQDNDQEDHTQFQISLALNDIEKDSFLLFQIDNVISKKYYVFEVLPYFQNNVVLIKLSSQQNSTWLNICGSKLNTEVKPITKSRKYSQFMFYISYQKNNFKYSKMSEALLYMQNNNYRSFIKMIISGNPINNEIQNDDEHSQYLILLDQYQQKAFNLAISHKISIIQGSAGTGKTYVSVQIVKYLSNKYPKILVCSQTERSCDYVCRSLCDIGVNCIRFTSDISDYNQQNDIEKQLIHNITQQGVLKLLKDYADSIVDNIVNHLDDVEIERLKQYIVDPPSIQQLHTDKINNPKTALQLYCQIYNSIIDEHKVIVTSLIDSDHELLRKTEFQYCLIEDAQNSIEPLQIIPLQHKVEHITLVGDEKQISPNLLCSVQHTQSFQYSLMTRLLNCEFHTVALEQQHRMSKKQMKLQKLLFDDQV